MPTDETSKSTERSSSSTVGTNVVSLFGKYVHKPGSVSKDLVDELTKLLRQAKSGEIIGLAGSIYYKDTCTRSITSGVLSYTLLGGLTMASHKVITALEGAEDG